MTALDLTALQPTGSSIAALEESLEKIVAERGRIETAAGDVRTQLDELLAFGGETEVDRLTAQLGKHNASLTRLDAAREKITADLALARKLDAEASATQQARQVIDDYLRAKRWLREQYSDLVRALATNLANIERVNREMGRLMISLETVPDIKEAIRSLVEQEVGSVHSLPQPGRFTRLFDFSDPEKATDRALIELWSGSETEGRGYAAGAAGAGSHGAAGGKPAPTTGRPSRGWPRGI